MNVGIVTLSQVDIALDLAEQLHQSEVSVSLYADQQLLIKEVGDSSESIDQIFTSGVLPSDIRINPLNFPRMRDIRSFQAIKKLARTIEEDGLDLIQILLNPGEIWLALLPFFVHKVPVVTSMFVPLANVGDRLPKEVIWTTNWLATLGSDMIIVNGEDQVKLVQKIYGIHPNKVSYIPLTMNTHTTRWISKVVPEKPGSVMFFGRAHPHKGLEYLIKAQPLISQRVPWANIIISAHGDNLQHCKEFIVDPSKFEIYEGYISGTLMAELFQKASLVITPYITSSSSGVLVAAYSFGKPVVATRVGCLAEYVGEGVTGLLVEPANIEALADAIARLLLDDDLRHLMGENAKKWIINMQRSVINQTLAVYKNTISSKMKKR